MYIGISVIQYQFNAMLHLRVSERIVLVKSLNSHSKIFVGVLHNSACKGSLVSMLK